MRKVSCFLQIACVQSVAGNKNYFEFAHLKDLGAVNLKRGNYVSW